MSNYVKPGVLSGSVQEMVDKVGALRRRRRAVGDPRDARAVRPRRPRALRRRGDARRARLTRARRSVTDRAGRGRRLRGRHDGGGDSAARSSRGSSRHRPPSGPGGARRTTRADGHNPGRRSRRPARRAPATARRHRRVVSADVERLRVALRDDAGDAGVARDAAQRLRRELTDVRGFGVHSPSQIDTRAPFDHLDARPRRSPAVGAPVQDRSRTWSSRPDRGRPAHPARRCADDRMSPA